MTKIEKMSIKRVIDKWDPIELLSSYAPPDEYDSETQKIYNLIKDKEIIKQDYLAKVIHDVFEKSFGGDVFLKKIDECKDISNNILSLSKNI
jgi:hypothetical protein